MKAINRALDGITVPTVVHLCFGYAFLVSNKPTSYFFLSELADSKAQQISIESAQPNIDLGVLKDLSARRSCSASSISAIRSSSGPSRSPSASVPG